ncbi:hemerythrin domain-containing protein [Microlunatus sp. Gsoil 973]|jgi:uncharacterized protein (DUF2249 family)|uniref:hemerythrin domain-containing protein n=1 Tax=Microlunatus sp. Gsoil 973 TaxID=2672569 RepID=UPI0012B46DBB|nr:hemerythrin domain-containing protein [Microlunatus sp. Gsoil 973]QGN32049.1 hypothetical protein GJV80_03715 [Microlunatus sp. Gsoil 973]
MMLTLDPSSSLVAVKGRHADLRAGLSGLTEAFITAVGDGVPSRTARDRLVSFLRTELLPHTEAEESLLYDAATRPETALLSRAMRDQHRTMTALIDEVEQGATMDAVVAAGALVVLCDLRIQQENEQLLPSLAATGLDLDGVLGTHPEIVGNRQRAGSVESAPGGRRTVDLRGLDYYNRRHLLYTALRRLGPGEEVRVISERPHDLSGLRYDMEERIAQRYSWITHQGENAAYTIVRCPCSWSDESITVG